MPAPLTTTFLAASAILLSLSTVATVVFLVLAVLFELAIAYAQGVDGR